MFISWVSGKILYQKVPVLSGNVFETFTRLTLPNCFVPTFGPVNWQQVQQRAIGPKQSYKHKQYSTLNVIQLSSTATCYSTMVLQLHFHQTLSSVLENCTWERWENGWKTKSYMVHGKWANVKCNSQSSQGTRRSKMSWPVTLSVGQNHHQHVQPKQC